MSNEESTQKQTASTQDLNQIVKSAVESAINSFKTELTESYQAKISEAVQASQAKIITPSEMEISDPNATLDFVKKVITEDNIERSKYAKFKTHMVDDMAKNKILMLKSCYPYLTAEQIHKELFES